MNCVYIFRRKNWFIDTWEQKLLYMSAFGILKKIKMNSVPDNVIPEPKEEIEPLTMEPFVLAFLILLSGCLISTVAFALEVCNFCTSLTH